jgi:hypothetical protein
MFLKLRLKVWAFVVQRIYTKCQKNAEITVERTHLHAGFPVLARSEMQYSLLYHRVSNPAIPPPLLQLWIDCADEKSVLKVEVARKPDAIKLAARQAVNHAGFFTSSGSVVFGCAPGADFLRNWGGCPDQFGRCSRGLAAGNTRRSQYGCFEPACSR